MNGAIFFSGQYGSTAQYAGWISDATGLPVFDVKHADADPSKFDFLILGSSVITYNLTISKWVKRNLAGIQKKPIVLFTVSGAPAGPKLDGWVADSLAEIPMSKMRHVALRGRMNPKTLGWWTRMILIMGAMKNRDPQARKEELAGFDYMDKSGIEPITKMVQQLQSNEAPVFQ